MGVALSLRIAAELARITLPTFAEALVGSVDRDTADRRIASFARRVVELSQMKLDVRGADAVPRDRAFVYMSNHQSHIDIPVLYATMPARTLRMVAKAELFRVPMWGRAMRAADFVEVDRNNRAQAIASLERAADTIAAGVSIWIAPEGSRSRTGRLGPLKKGGFHLAADTGTPIVPVAISGTGAVLPPGGRSMRTGCPVRIVYGAPIPVAGRAIPDLMADVADFLSRNTVPTNALAGDAHSAA